MLICHVNTPNWFKKGLYLFIYNFKYDTNIKLSCIRNIHVTEITIVLNCSLYKFFVKYL